MPLSQQIPITNYLGNGTTTNFPFTFKIIQEDDLSVYFDSILVGTGYYIEGIGNENGGTVIFYDPPAAGVKVAFERHVPFDRSTDYLNGGPLEAETLDNDFDRIIMMIQDLNAYSYGYVINSYSNKIEEYVATQGQTIFNTTNAIAIGKNSISVFVNGVFQTPSVSYAETNATRITFTEGLDAGDKVTIQFEIAKKLDTIDAVDTNLEDIANYYVSENVEDALQEIGFALNSIQSSAFSGDYDDLTNKPFIPTDTSDLTNGAGFLTSFTETDPVFTAWDKSTGISITESQISDLQSYLTTETDPVFVASDAYSITSADMADWSTAFGWGDHSAAGYLTSFTETDPVFTAWDKSTGISITESQISDLGSYLTSVALNDVSDVVITTPTTDQVLKYDGTNWVNSTAPAGATDLDGLTDVYVPSPSSNQLLKYNGSVWVSSNYTLDELQDVQIAGASTGQLLRFDTLGGWWYNWTPNYISAVSQDSYPSLGGDLYVNNHVITTSISNGNIVLAPDGTGIVDVQGTLQTDKLQIDTTATPTGSVAGLMWNDDEGTIEFQLKGGNVTLQIGQEMVQYVYNDTGSTLSDSQVVYISGSQGQKLTVALASASSESSSSKTIGVVTESIADEASGFITTNGIVHGLNTSAYAPGTALWLSTTAGQYTSTRPSAPNHGVFIGWVIRQHATSGSIYVHIQNGYELNEIHDVLITSASNNQTLIWDSTATVWKNTDLKTINGNSIIGSGDLTITGGSGITDVVQDLTPQLGGNLDCNGHNITTSQTNGSIAITSKGSGIVTINGLALRETNGNIIIGTDANGGGSYNVTIGYKAGDVLAAGSNTNVIIGYQSGSNVTNGDNNVFLGNRAGATTINFSNTVIIGGHEGAGISSGSIVLATGSGTARIIVDQNGIVKLGTSADFNWDDTNKILNIGGQWVETHLGSRTVAGNPVLAFHSSGTSTSDAQIYSDSGSGANDGDLYFSAGYEYHSGSVVYIKTADNVFAQLRSNAGYDRYLKFTTGNSDRWYLGTDGTAESGSNAGSNFYLKSFDDSGATIGTPLTVNRATGNITFTGTLTGNGSGLTTLNASNLSSGTVNTARLGSGTADSTTYLRGDGTWATPVGGSGAGETFNPFLLMGC